MQSLPIPTNLKQDVLIEHALKQKYRIITTLTFSKYSSPISTLRKPKGQLRILVILRRVDHLIKHDYEEHNHQATMISDAALA